MYKTQQQGSASIMVWAAFGINGKSKLSFTDVNMNSLIYLQILEAHLLSFISEAFQGQAAFQQDNAPIHALKVTKAWLKEHNVKVLQWPPKSPDLNHYCLEDKRII